MLPTSTATAALVTGRVLSVSTASAQSTHKAPLSHFRPWPMLRLPPVCTAPVFKLRLTASPPLMLICTVSLLFSKLSFM